MIQQLVNKIPKVLTGYGLILYGIVKLFLFSLSVFIPHKCHDSLVHEFSFLKWFLTKDRSILGIVFLFAVFVYGIYSLLYGLVALEMLPSSWTKLLTNELFTYILCAIVGLILILTTSLYNMSSSENEDLKITNLISGYMFVGAIPVTYIYTNGFHGPDTVSMLLLFCSISIIGTKLFIASLS